MSFRNGEEKDAAGATNRSSEDKSRGGGGYEDEAAIGPQLELEHAIGYSCTGGGPFYHPNGKDFVVAAGGTVAICDFNDAHQQVLLHGHDANITCLALSKSGALIASGQHGENADAIVWDFASKRLLYRLAEHDYGVGAVAFSDDEKLLVTVGVEQDRKILVWDMSNGFIVTIAQHNPAPVVTACWGGFVKNVKRRDTADYLLATAGHNDVCLWALNPFTGEMRGERMMHEGRGAAVRQITAIAFSDDKETVFAATTTGDFILGIVKTNLLGQRVVRACSLGVHSLLCWPEGVICGGGDGTVTAFGATTMQDTAQSRLKGAVVGMSFSPDRMEVVAGTDLGFIYRVRVETMASLVVSQNHFGPVTAVAYARNCSDRFATSSTDCTLRIWDAGDYTVVTQALVRDAGAPACLLMTLDMLISGWTDGNIRAHDVDSGHLLWTIDNAHQNGVTSIVLSGNERYIMSGGQEGELRVWELRSRDLITHLKQHGQRVPSIALFGDDVHALSASRDRTLICWNLRTEKQVSNHSQRMGGINAVALSRDQTTVITVGQEKRVNYWDLREHNPTTVRDLTDDMSDEALCLDIDTGEGEGGEGGGGGGGGVQGSEEEGEEGAGEGTGRSQGRAERRPQLFATGGTGKALRLWDFETARQVATGKGHSNTIRGVKFSPDGRQIVTAGEDGNILVWNVYT